MSNGTDEVLGPIIPGPFSPEEEARMELDIAIAFSQAIERNRLIGFHASSDNPPHLEATTATSDMLRMQSTEAGVLVAINETPYGVLRPLAVLTVAENVIVEVPLDDSVGLAFVLWLPLDPKAERNWLLQFLEQAKAVWIQQFRKSRAPTADELNSRL